MAMNPKWAAIILLLGMALFLMAIRPASMFDEETGQFRNFGCLPGQTLLPFWLAITLVGILGYAIALRR